MKKGLLCLLGASMLVAPSFAQEEDRTEYEPFMEKFDSLYSVYLDASNRCAGIKDLTGSETEALWTGATWDKKIDYDVKVENGTLSISKTIVETGQNWATVDLEMVAWKGGTEAKFPILAEKDGVNVDTLTGMFVDMSIDDQVVMNLTVRTDEDCVLRIDLVDANGRQGNGKAPADYQNSVNLELKAADGWQTKEITWSAPMFDYYSPNFWGVTNGIGKGDAPLWAADGDTLKLSIEKGIPVSMQTISKIQMIVDDGNLTNPGDVGSTKTVEIKDLSLGMVSDDMPSFMAVTDKNIASGAIKYDPKNAVLVRARQDIEFGPSIFPTTPAPSETVSVEETATIDVYPNPASDVINVEGEATVSTLAGSVVATGVGSVDVSALAAGTYVVKTSEGSAVISVK